jgi:hypothetical protein
MIRLVRLRMKSTEASSKLYAVESFRVQLPVESLQGFILGKTSFPEAARHPAFAPGGGLCPQQSIQKPEVRKALFFRLR